MADESKNYAWYEVCVLCAKVEEAREVIAHFRKKFDILPRPNSTEVAFRTNIPRMNKETGESEYLRILVTFCSGMGNTSTAIRVAQIISAHHPTLLIFFGTAASLQPDKVQIGDVIIPKRAVYRNYDKVSERGQRDYLEFTAAGDFSETIFAQENALISDLATIDCSPEGLIAIAAVDTASIPMEAGPEGKITLGERDYQLRAPSVIDDIDIFSCGMVVDSVSYREHINAVIRKISRKIWAIDMESYGFFNTIEASKKTGAGSVCEGVMIRGISDYAGRKQQTETLPQEWRKISLKNAAHVCSELITSHSSRG